MVAGLAERGAFDALRVIDQVVTRAATIGIENYPPLDIAADRRDFVREAGEELFDAVFYTAAEIVRRRDLSLADLRHAAWKELDAFARSFRSEIDFEDEEPTTETRVADLSHCVFFDPAPNGFRGAVHRRDCPSAYGNDCDLTRKARGRR